MPKLCSHGNTDVLAGHPTVFLLIIVVHHFVLKTSKNKGKMLLISFCFAVLQPVISACFLAKLMGSECSKFLSLKAIEGN